MQRPRNIPAELPEAEIIDVQALKRSLADGSVELVCVLGPTASGKTKYAVALARELGGEIISADSRQVYRGMDIGTGKDLAEYGEIPYHVIDVANPGDGYNVFRFKEDFQKAYDDIRSRGVVPILCGGTGLYINAVTAGYDFRTHKPLSEPMRWPIESAMTEATGSSSDVPRTYFIGTLVSREVRNARIDARLDARLQEGMVDEIKGLLDNGVPAATLISYGLEYKYVTLYLTGELEYAAMREKLAIAIHQFAKRQMTWFRGMERSGTIIHWTEVK